MYPSSSTFTPPLSLLHSHSDNLPSDPSLITYPPAASAPTTQILSYPLPTLLLIPSSTLYPHSSPGPKPISSLCNSAFNIFIHRIWEIVGA